jgi:hypothetical protein
MAQPDITTRRVPDKYQGAMTEFDEKTIERAGSHQHSSCFIPQFRVFRFIGAALNAMTGDIPRLTGGEVRATAWHQSREPTNERAVGAGGAHHWFGHGTWTGARCVLACVLSSFLRRKAFPLEEPSAAAAPDKAGRAYQAGTMHAKGRRPKCSWRCSIACPD